MFEMMNCSLRLSLIVVHLYHSALFDGDNSKLTEIQSRLSISLATATDAATTIDNVGHSCGHKITLKSSLDMREKIKGDLV